MAAVRIIKARQQIRQCRFPGSTAAHERHKLSRFDGEIDPSQNRLLPVAEMDILEDDFAAGFVFDNPNAKGACGCGESFTV